MVKVPRLSSTFSAEIWGIWNSSIRLIPSCRVPSGSGVAGPAWALLRVELDDELLLHRRVDLRTLGVAQHLRCESVVIGLQPGRYRRREVGGVPDRLRGTRPG